MSKFNFEALRSRLAAPQRLKPFPCYFMTNNSPPHLQSLPPDVLREIFERYIDGHRQDQSRFLMRSSKDAPWFLGHVCQLWRETAISTPRLWNHLPPFKFTAENEVLRTHPMFEELVKRSGTQLLRIQFDFTYYKGDVSMGIISALRFLIATSERWEELTIRGLNLWHMHNNFNSIGNRIPNLRRVQLLSFCDIFDFMEENDLEEHLDIFADAPVLSEILFRNLSSSFWRSFPIVPWKQLVKYQNMNGGRGWFYQVLKRAENLETLMAAECNFREDSIEPFEHPRLHHLQAHVDNTPISFLSSLEELKLPALSTLVTTFDPQTSSPELHAAPVLMSLIIRSQCNLKTLVLSQGPLHDFEVLELLAVTPNLETLELGDCANLNNALSRLEFKQTEPTLLPSLRALTLVFPTTMHPRHVRTILRIAESRKESVANKEDKSSSHLLHPLKCICITIQKADFRYQACLDLNREPAESDIKVSVSAHEAQVSVHFSRIFQRLIFRIICLVRCHLLAECCPQ